MNILKFYGQTAKYLTRTCSTCIPPKSPKVDITVLGSMQPMGKTIAFLLKQCQGIETVKLYGYNNYVCEVGMDLCHIDTNTKVRAFQGGSDLLAESIKGSNIIIICGGEPFVTGESQEAKFLRNVDAIRHFGIHIAEYNPNAIVLLATPPINSLIPLLSEEYKKAGVYNPRKLIGLSNVASIRANSILALHLGTNPTHYLCPVIGGLCPNTTVPLISQVLPKVELNETESVNLMRLIANAEVLIAETKYLDNTGSYYLPTAFAAVRFVNSMIRALKGGRDVYECAFVRQTGHIEYFASYMSTICQLGPEGVEKTYMPKLNELETKELKKAFPHLVKAIRMGQNFVTGEVSRNPRSKAPLPDSESYIANPDVIGDVAVDLSKKYRNFKIFQ